MIKSENGTVIFEGTAGELYVDMIELLTSMNKFLDEQKPIIKFASTDVDFLEPLANLAKKVL